MRGATRSVVAGAVAGTAATLVMSVVFVVARRAGLYSEHPPEKVVEEATDPDGPLPTLRPHEQEGAWRPAHVAFGALVGAAYGLARPRLPRRLRGPAGGVALAMSLWLLSYGAVAPALGLLPSIGNDDRGRQAANAAAHLVYGTALAVTLQRLDR